MAAEAWHLTQLFRSRAQSHVVSVITSAKQPSCGRIGTLDRGEPVSLRSPHMSHFVPCSDCGLSHSGHARARTPTFLSIQEGKKGQSTVTFVHFLLLLNRVRCTERRWQGNNNIHEGRTCSVKLRPSDSTFSIFMRILPTLRIRMKV